MGKSWALISHLYSVAGPSITLLYPLYASICVMESPSDVDYQQWLTYWILYSIITLLEPVLHWIPVWYPVKVLFMAWLVLPQFNGAYFVYEKFVKEQFVREQLRKYRVQLASYAAGGWPHKDDADNNVPITRAEPDFVLAKRKDSD